MDRKVLLFGGLFAILLVAWVVIIFVPSQNEIKSLGLRLEELKAKEQARISPMDVQILTNRVDSLEVRVAQRAEKIYPGEKLLDLGRTMEKLGSQYNLKLLSITPDYESLHLFREENQISDLPVQMNFEGNFRDFGRFLDERSTFPFMIRVHRVTMDKAEPEDKKLTISLNGVLVIGNRLKPQTGPAAGNSRIVP